MSKDRDTLLANALRVSPEEVRWYFTADYYDGPISGLAIFRGRICRFCCFPEDIPSQHVYVLHELQPDELAEELRIKEKCEAYVGTHFSFDTDGKSLAHVVRSQDSWKRFYEEERTSDRV